MSKPRPKPRASHTPKRPAKPLPKRTARTNPLRQALRFSKIFLFFTLAYLSLKALYDYHPLQRVRHGFLSSTQQAGLKLETLVIQNKASAQVVGYVLLKECSTAKGILVLDGCYRSKQTYTFHTPLRQVVDTLTLAPEQPMLTVEPSVLRRRLLELPWIKEAVVSRRMPKTLVIALEERIPMASWEDEDGALWILDGEGRRITRKTATNAKDTLFVLHGMDAPAHLPDLLTLLRRQPRVQAWVIAATWAGGRRWTLTLRNGIEVHLPESGAAAALDQLAVEETHQKLFTRGYGRITILPGASWTFTPVAPPTTKKH